MKFPVSTASNQPAARRIAVRGFTLPETLIVTAIFALLVLATVTSQVFGLRLYKISDAKLATTADARRALNEVRDEIQSGRLLYVGNGDAYSFKLIPDNEAHIGNAIKICATTDTNDFVYYYVDTVDARLNRMVSGSSNVIAVARCVTNQMVFRAEDYRGNVLTNYQNNRVIRMTLQFYRKEFAAASKGALYDYYQLQTRIARRGIE